VLPGSGTASGVSAGKLFLGEGRCEPTVWCVVLSWAQVSGFFGGGVLDGAPGSGHSFRKGAGKAVVVAVAAGEEVVTQSIRH
jgi:hypothetical protein